MHPPVRVSILTGRVLLLMVVLLTAGCGSPEQKAQGFYERGMKFLSQKDHVKASLEFKNALQLKKDMVGPWRGLLEVEIHNKNLEGTVAALRSIVELEPADIQARLKLGNLLLYGNALDQALEQANAAVALDDKISAAHAFRGAVYLKLKNPIEAKREAEYALELDPKSSEALMVLAAERMVRGDLEGALLLLDREGAAHQNIMGIQIFQLLLVEKAGDLKRAEGLLKKLTEQYPEQRSFRSQLIQLYINQKRYDEAEKELRATAAADPIDTDASLNVVRFLQQVKGLP